MDAVLTMELDELSKAIDRVLSERDRYKADAERLAKCLHYFMDNNAKRFCTCERCTEGREALMAHEEARGK